uniref:Pre-rRNA-processing protein RIX1 N-terminal domain-containing protein n=1 Tax=Arion vulgaris TaxID=1028688 RepID=A0A0B6Y744_9EUPU
MTMFTGASSTMSTEGGKNKKTEEWTNKCNLLLKSMEEVLSVLYDGLETDQDDNLTSVEKEQISTLQGHETIPEVANIFTQHCQKLVGMISEPTSGPVLLPLGSVLSIVTRCLRVSYADVRSLPSMSETAGVLPTLHRAALEILSQLIMSCKTNLLPRSRPIIDLCLQAMSSARHMNMYERSNTLAGAYQALRLIVLMFGWSRYLTHQCKTIIQELISDIKWQSSAKQTSATNTDPFKQEKVKEQKKRGKGKKKKNKAESYSGLTKTNAAGENSIKEYATSNLESTFQALELSQLVLERAEFLSVENLMRCILDTAQTVQHEAPPVRSPYANTDCRKLLYSTVFACSTVKLNHGCSRKDSITHFQMTNLALSLLSDGLQKDRCYEVQHMCKESLNVLLLTGNLNRPIIRRIQPDDTSTTKDPAELEKEIENVKEESGTLQKRLLDSEMENQTQKRLIATLRQEVETLKEKRTKTSTSCSDQKVYLTDPTDYRSLTDNGSEDLCDNEFEKEESSDEEDEIQEVAKRNKKLEGSAEKEKLHDKSKNVLEANCAVASIQADEHEKDASQGSLEGLNKKAKRKFPTEPSKETPRKKKKSKMDLSINNNKTDVLGGQSSEEKKIECADDIQDMISDFVDADPDTV